MIRFSNPGIHPGPGRLKGGRADHASARIRLRDPWCFRSDPSCGARPRSAAARPGGGGPDTGMNRGGGGRQEAGFPQEPAPKFSTATPWFVSGSRNIRGARLHGPGRGVPEGAASLTEAVPDRVPEGPVRGETRGVLHRPESAATLRFDGPSAASGPDLRRPGAWIRHHRAIFCARAARSQRKWPVLHFGVEVGSVSGSNARVFPGLSDGALSRASPAFFRSPISWTANRRNCPAASGSGSRSGGRSFAIPRSSCSTNPCRTSM